ncbi:MAG: mechanosensitive ion channel [Candidatus Pacebacteria bacterium]|nr:mechanosensitive ion channel [Candidatus Paceibacterota bacterium]
MEFGDISFIEESLQWFLVHGIRIIVILMGAYLLNYVGQPFIFKIARHFIENSFIVGKLTPALEEKRVQTLKKAFASVFRTAVWALAVLTILPELGISTAPLLTGLGIGGLIIGIGSRNVMQDYWSGLFIIMEDQFRVGEKVNIADLEGTVQNFSLRRTILRNAKGYFSYIPNSQITKVTNFSRKSLKEVAGEK